MSTMSGTSSTMIGYPQVVYTTNATATGWTGYYNQPSFTVKVKTEAEKQAAKRFRKNCEAADRSGASQIRRLFYKAWREKLLRHKNPQWGMW